MGKIRVRTLGDETKEKKEKKEAQVRAQAKKVEDERKAQKETAAKPEELVKTEPAAGVETEKKKGTKKAKGSKVKKQKHSANFLALSEKVEKNKKYQIDDALVLLGKLKRAKFDESVELHINTTDKGISGTITLPHGTGKEIRIEIADQSEDPKHVEEIVKKVEAGKIDFDVLIATPDAMPRLARVARHLGPRGLMPNPKNGTVNPKPQEVAKKFQGGQVNFKTEAKFSLLHLMVGKISFGDKKLAENIKTALTAVQIKNIKDITLKSTMSPAIKLDISSV